VAVTAIVAIHLWIVQPEKRFYEDKRLEAERLALVLESHLLAEMMGGKPDNIQRHMALLPGLSGISQVDVLDTQMVVRFSTDSTRVGQRLDRNRHPRCQACHARPALPVSVVHEGGSEVTTFMVNHVLHNEPRCRRCHGEDPSNLGNIVVELILTPQDLEQLAASRRLLLSGAILLLVLLAGLAALIYTMVGRPAAALGRKMKLIQAGTFDIGRPRAATDELGLLDRGFHQMVDELRSLYAHMEERIRERTDSLYRTQAQVMHQEKLAALGQLAAGVAHEIGNPLTSIDSMVQLLAMQTDDPEQRESLRVVQRQVDRMAEIVHHMSDLSRPLSVTSAEVDINQVLESVLGLVRFDPRFRKIAIRRELDYELPRLRIIEDRLFGVLLNLALNAADAMPEGGELSVRSWAEGDHLAVAVADSGHGIPLEHRERIFEPFFTTKSPDRGTGLGLSVCRTFLEGVGGWITVESEPGQGAIFTVRIPLSPPDEQDDIPD
jgi:signal transduction histidine kinase